MSRCHAAAVLHVLHRRKSFVNLTCPMNYTLGDLNSSFSLTCESDGNWTYVDPDILICRIGKSTVLRCE
ncbi:hypothetical protein E2C01_076170 [Portunus trituberculatus]|uniref:Sushi domain-containing protein n=1 Tax=Portunus trituberculatus TaxID=210409 RepID=A0A5B7IJ54_PORTR|nr:hypothetical protein [Portunus trituberculatus]